MKRQSKWLNAKPQRPARRVARLALRDRLRWVWRMLRFASEASYQRPEAVHQLRVATRRASTVIELLHEQFPTKKINWIEKRLKKLRRAAGKARDLDVLALHYHSLAETTREVQKFEKFMIDLREKSRKPIKKVFRKLSKDKADQHIRQAISKPNRKLTKATEHISFGQYSLGKLTSLWHDYIQTADLDLGNIEQLHEFRIATKEFRYALELFACAIPEEPRTAFYNRIIAMQDALGAVNDHAVAIPLLQKVAKKIRGKAVGQWINEEIPRREQDLVRAHQDFLRDWPAKHSELLAAWQELVAPLTGDVVTGDAAASSTEHPQQAATAQQTVEAELQQNGVKNGQHSNGNGHSENHSKSPEPAKA